MVQILEEGPSLAQRLLAGLGNVGMTASQLIPQELQRRQQQRQSSGFGKQLGIEGFEFLDPKIQQAIVTERIKGSEKERLQNQKLSYLNELMKSGFKPKSESIFEEVTQENIPSNYGDITDEQILEATAIDPNIGRAMQHAKDVSLRESREKEALKRKTFQEERKYHSDYAKEAEKKISALRETIPRKTSALELARNAVESGDLSFFSPDKLADITGIDLFRSAKGSQLITASKENLLSNMSRMTARAANMWMEQRLNSMFPKIGQSKEANLTVQEMLEGELALDQAYMNLFDKISSEDENQYGFVKKDIEKRVRDQLKPLEKEIFGRTVYRLKELEEEDKGIKSLQKEIGKNVPKGTPLTLYMAKLYKDKFGDKALDVAKKNGYTIPTIEDYRIYQEKPMVYREGL